MGVMDLRRRAIVAGNPYREYQTSGNPATFNTNVTRNLKSLVIPFTPVQSGSGDPSPNNDRPITGWTGANAWIGDVNWNQIVSVDLLPSKNQYGITGVNNGDGSYSVSGTNTGTNYDSYRSIMLSKNHVYYHTGAPSDASSDSYYLYFNGKADIGNGRLSKAAASDYRSLDIIVKSNYAITGTKVFYPQVFDLTAMFGGTVANAVYDMEEATTGSGIAWVKQRLPKQYYAYKEPDNEQHTYACTAASCVFPAVGKNLFDKSTPIENKQYTASGNFVSENSRIITDYIPITRNETYTISLPINNSASLCLINYNLFDANKTWLGDRSKNGESASFSGDFVHTFTPSLTGACYVRIVLRDAQNASTSINGRTLENADLMLEKGSSATTYEPYTNTIYGGYVDPVRGVAVATYGAEVFDGSVDETWEKHNTGSASAFAMKHTYATNMIKANTVIIANYLKYLTTSVTWGNFDNWISSGSMANIITGIQSITTVDAWRAYLAENNLVVCYELATPITYQLTPQQITTLIGTNTIWSDTNGSNTVTYQKRG